LPDDFNESYDVWIEDASKSEVESWAKRNLNMI
jgi:hypothetical protein